MRTMLTALGSRRDSLKNEEGQKGFTLIELLVVVIIIGILAAIAIPVYIGVQNNAKDSSAQSDVVNLKTAVVSMQTNTGTLPADAAVITGGAPTTAAADAGASKGTNTTTLYYKAGTGSAFCVSGLSSTGSVFFGTHTGGVTKAASTVTTAAAACP